MNGRLIRCLCGEMFDPEAHAACPACGRTSVPQAQPRSEGESPPAAKAARPVRAPSASVGLPGWLLPALAVAIAVTVLVWMLSSPDDRPATGNSSRAEDTTRPSRTHGCSDIAGDWSWFTGGFVHFAADGRAFFKPTEDAPPALTADWECDDSTGAYTVRWSHGFTETIKLYDNGNVVQGVNNVGVDVTGKRYVNPASRMPPLRTEPAGSQQIPSNLPALARAAQQVATDWRPDAIPVQLRIRKEGRTAQTDFYVQQSFVSPSEQTGLWVTTNLTGSKIREAGTVSWSQRELPLDFIDLSEAIRVARKAGLRGLIDRAELEVRGRGDRPTWFIAPELHGQGAAVIDAISGQLVSKRGAG